MVEVEERKGFEDAADLLQEFDHELTISYGYCKCGNGAAQQSRCCRRRNIYVRIRRRRLFISSFTFIGGLPLTLLEPSIVGMLNLFLRS